MAGAVRAAHSHVDSHRGPVHLRCRCCCCRPLSAPQPEPLNPQARIRKFRAITTMRSAHHHALPPILASCILALAHLARVEGATAQDSQFDSNPFSFALDFAGGNGLEYTLSVLLIVWGIALLVLGVRLFKISLFTIAWIAVGGLVYYLSMLASSGDSRASFIAAMVIGTAAGALVVWLYMLGLILVGAFGAFVLWNCFETLFPSAVPAGGAYTFLALALLAGGLLAWFFQKWVLLFATPVIGTFLFSQGLSKYLHDDSLRINTFEILHGDSGYSGTNSAECMGLFAGFVAITALGFMVQWSECRINNQLHMRVHMHESAVALLRGHHARSECRSCGSPRLRLSLCACACFSPLLAGIGRAVCARRHSHSCRSYAFNMTCGRGSRTGAVSLRFAPFLLKQFSVKSFANSVLIL